MDSLLKTSAAAFAEFAGTNWGDLISHVEHLKTFFYHIAVPLVIGVNVLSVVLFLWMLFITQKKSDFVLLACFVAPGRFKTRDISMLLQL